MFTVANSISLSAPLARVWRVLVDVDRYRDWHPTVGVESDPADPKKLLSTYWRPGWTDPVISADGRIVCLERTPQDRKSTRLKSSHHWASRMTFFAWTNNN